MEKYILFGAGNFGKSALRYYGENVVRCFADNNVNKQGSVFCGKQVISFEEAAKLSAQYTIVISTAYAFEIKRQFDIRGITNYICYTPAYEHFVEYMKSRLSEAKPKRIVLYGIDNDTRQIIEALDMIGGKGKIELYVVASNDIQDNWSYEYTIIKNLDEMKKYGDADCYIVAASAGHTALYAELRQKFREALVLDPYKQSAYYDTEEIVFNPYIAEDAAKSEEDWNRLVDRNDIKKDIRSYVDIVSRDVPLFEYIEIETVNKCNGVCSFCPVNKKVDPRPYMKMRRELFEKIINELSVLHYSGELSLFSNNEPLLDDRIVELHCYAREKLPNARIHLFTNGTLFTLPLFKELIPYLDELIIDNYMQELRLIKPVKEIRDYVEEHPELRRKVTVVLRKPDEILTSRGGDAPNRKDMVSYRGETCALPFEQMIIRPDGKVSLCCNDPLGKNTLGDVSQDLLTDVWYGLPYQKLRECIARGREHWEHCEYCDTFYLY